MTAAPCEHVRVPFIQGFVRERAFDSGDGGVERVVFQKVVVPPWGRWFINISTFDGGLVSVHTSTLD